MFAFGKQSTPSNKRALLLVVKCQWAQELPWENTCLLVLSLSPEPLSHELSGFVGLGV